jgi:hypothetical protein
MTLKRPADPSLPRGRTAIAALLLAVFIGSLPADAASGSAGDCAVGSSSAPALPPARFEEGPTIAPADLVADFDGWLAGMRSLNPDLSIRADIPRLDREAARIRGTLTRPMSRREAWAHFARLNPYLGDGHNGISMPDYRDTLEAYVKSGGRIVPIEMRFAADKSLRVFAAAPGINAIKPGDQVLSINGRSADRLVRAMLDLAPGDTPAQRRAWVARRFGALYWLLYGDTGQYDLAVRSVQSGCRLQLRLAGAANLPVSLQPNPKAEDQFAWRVLPGGIGYLRVDGFDPEQRDALASVAQTAFTAFKEQKARAVIIDVRENGGGDDPLWQQSLMEFITDKPYAQLSRYVARITKENADPGDVIGDVKRAEYTGRFTPNPVDPVRFDGPAYILAGPFSYSATIQFIVAAQDFGIAKIAGEKTGALSCQTGQVRRIAMPKTGLFAFTPLIAYTRPSGVGCERGVIPDVPIAIDEIMPDVTLKSLATRIGG